MTAYEKDLDDTLYENYICLHCGFRVMPNFPPLDECGCDEE
tara:strand:+ start:105 stop:227 length:123 start_codon:yes stop_codon:yes gene_type:complete